LANPSLIVSDAGGILGEQILTIGQLIHFVSYLGYHEAAVQAVPSHDWRDPGLPQEAMTGGSL
jgi:hypothetical protein